MLAASSSSPRLSSSPSGSASASASDHSGLDSDSDVSSQRVHPQRLELPALHGFGCDFSRGRCGHDELFHPHYTRTNLRKGDKILRCFPHCCPDHVARSFCGSSLHLDVRWNPSSASSSSSSSAIPELMVFARFRVKDTRGLTAGDHVTLHEISQSLQNEGNPHGEWIPSRIVSSASDRANNSHDWVFEINHDARWYYHWESGVAKRHRLKHHVLDVYVLSPSFTSATSSIADEDHRPLQVVASTYSPPFRLISFRRATPKAVLALSVPRVPADARPVRRVDAADSAPKTKRSRTEELRSELGSASPQRTVPIRRPRSPPRSSAVPPIRHHREAPLKPSSSTWTRPVSQQPSFADLAASVPSRGHAAGWSGHNCGPQYRLPPPPPPPPVTTAEMRSAERLLRLFKCLELVRIADSVHYMDSFLRVYTDSVYRVTGVDCTPLSSISPVDAMRRVVHNAADGPRVGATGPLPQELVAILSEVLLWLCFDVDFRSAIHTTLSEEAAAVFSQPRLQATYAAFLEWLERHVDAFLRDRGWSLEDVVHKARSSLRGPMAMSLEALSSQNAFTIGLRMLVSQLSETYIQQTRKSRRRLSVPHQPHAQFLQWTQAVDGVWYCPMIQGGFQLDPAATAMGGGSLLGLFTLMRELSAIRLRVDSGEDGKDATVDVSSLLNLNGQGGGSHLRLNSKVQWLRTLPTGLSTSALSMGGLSWGDYVGSLSSSTQELLVDLYGWRGPASPTQPHGTTGPIVDLGQCIQLRLWTPTRDTLLVRVRISRALLDRAAASTREGLTTTDSVVAQLPFWPLARKLGVVRAWESTLSAELHYQRLA